MKRFLIDKGEAIFLQKQAAGKAAAVAAKDLMCIGRRKADLALPGFQAAQTGKSQTGPFGIRLPQGPQQSKGVRKVGLLHPALFLRREHPLGSARADTGAALDVDAKRQGGHCCRCHPGGVGDGNKGVDAAEYRASAALLLQLHARCL